MRYSGIIYNDFSAAPGVCLTLFTQGCPHKCKGCHNQESWDYEGGMQFTAKTLSSIISGLTANGINRNLCIMGGEPLCEENLFLTLMIIKFVKQSIPDTKIYIWTGYTIEELKKSTNIMLQEILETIDCLIDGPYIEEERDITLPMRGSRNQRIIELKPCL